MEFYAHSKENEPPENWQLLDDHLHNVAERAAEFASAFGAEEWGRGCGLLHDVGKGTFAWQAYIYHANNILAEELKSYYKGRVEHAIAGAREAYSLSEQAGKVIAYCLSGHHGGMPNWEDSQDTALKSRLLEEQLPIQYGKQVVSLPGKLPLNVESERLGFQLQFFIRMLFSCLTDADFLDTEQALDPGKADWRASQTSFDKMARRFQMKFDALRQEADKILPVNQQREKVLQDCLSAADAPSGIFSMTVPTGGGKTLASLAFALKHAEKSNKRIIYVIPFTSIIEQNAAVFREMLGDDAVLEHHCNFIADDADWRSRLQSENWDAPVVVTTNVQFFDSFYSNKPSRCRKLHNVANSVVIFDEIQAIPVEKLQPCLEVIKELSLNYGVTSVLCTATQPALKANEHFKGGLYNVREIIGNVPTLFSSLKRTKETFIGELEEADVAGRLKECRQVLCIVNTRQQALNVFGALGGEEGNIHLSALMHPAHRSRQLAKIRGRLKNDETCRVISTQLIEAGVDVDFPVVYRAVTGIDSIAQAAGRCNRNGKLPVCDVFVFRFPENISCSFFRQAGQSAAKLFDGYDGRLTCPDCVDAYFRDYFWKNEQRMDEDGIVEDLCIRTRPGQYQFKEIANFQMIRTATVPIIVALEDNAVDLVKQLRYADHKGRILRHLQQFTVQVYPYQFDELRGWCELLDPGVWIMSNSEAYDDATGLNCKPPEGCAFFG